MPGTISGRTGGTCTGTNRCATTFMGVDFCGYYVVEQEFCYAVQPMIEQCKHLLQSCSESEGGATSSHCKSYDGYEASGLCPERGDAAVDATCKSLASGIPLPPGTWCGSVKDEDVCGQSFLSYPSEVDGYVDTTTCVHAPYCPPFFPAPLHLVFLAADKQPLCLTAMRSLYPQVPVLHL